MITFPNCKINLGLNVVGKRSDGYHNLETIFYPIELKDALEVVQSADLTFKTTGFPIEGSELSNLCLKAYNLIKKDFPSLPPSTIHLHKSIPMGAGLGGGSADAAFMLLALNKKYHLSLSTEQLLDYAFQLGSDCPFFIINKPCFAESRGEILTTIDVDLSSFKIVLVNPRIHISTKDAFALLTPKTPAKDIREIIKQPVSSWRNELLNDFEDSIFYLHPSIKEIKDQLYENGAVYASMTGSGSTVYGLFNKNNDLQLEFPADYLVIYL